MQLELWKWLSWLDMNEAVRKCYDVQKMLALETFNVCMRPNVEDVIFDLGSEFLPIAKLLYSRAVFFRQQITNLQKLKIYENRSISISQIYLETFQQISTANASASYPMTHKRLQVAMRHIAIIKLRCNKHFLIILKIYQKTPSIYLCILCICLPIYTYRLSGYDVGQML